MTVDLRAVETYRAHFDSFDAREAVFTLARLFVAMAEWETPDFNDLLPDDREEIPGIVDRGELFVVGELLKRAALRGGVLLSDDILRERATLRVRRGESLPQQDIDRLVRFAEELLLIEMRLASASQVSSPVSTRPRKNIDARMLAMIRDCPESLGWSVRKWASEMKCSVGTIGESQTWNGVLKIQKQLQQAEQAERMDRTRTTATRRHYRAGKVE